MGNKFLAGLLAGVILALVFVLYYLVRGRVFVAMLKGNSPEMAGMSDKAMYFMFLGAFAFMAILFGVAASVVYRFVGAPVKFLGLALGLAVVASILAIVSRTPMPVDKIFMNFAVGGILGWLVPLLAG